MIFRKGGRLPNNLNFLYKNSQIEIVKKCCYLGVVFTARGSCLETKKKKKKKLKNKQKKKKKKKHYLVKLGRQFLR